jgi:hypothetical protein
VVQFFRGVFLDSDLDGRCSTKTIVAGTIRSLKRLFFTKINGNHYGIMAK